SWCGRPDCRLCKERPTHGTPIEGFYSSVHDQLIEVEGNSVNEECTIRVGNSSTEVDLGWFWATQMQIHLLDSFDIVWIHAAKSNCWHTGMYRMFFAKYGLMRGKVGSYFSNGRNKKAPPAKKRIAIEESDCRFDEFKSSCLNELPNGSAGASLHDYAKAWRNVVEKYKNEGKYGFEPWSAALKTFWFYRPDAIPMFDNFALAGLRKVLKECELEPERSPVTNQNYLENFEVFWTMIGQKEARKAISLSPRKYPYLMRVVDKYLWLRGSPDKTLILNCFRESLEHTPIDGLTVR
ncbi:MAG: hypothetical protein MI741_00060, partial [Rhodospirillales bacterium]|nr:hypothetical protein [Rhodospirillales bacterium]